MVFGNIFESKKTVVAGLIILVGTSTAYVGIKDHIPGLVALGIINFVLGTIVKTQLEP